MTPMTSRYTLRNSRIFLLPLGLSLMVGAQFAPFCCPAQAAIIVSYSSPFDAASYDGRSNGSAPFAGVDPAGSNTPNFVQPGVTALSFSKTGAGFLTTLGVVDPGGGPSRDPANYVEWGWSSSPAADLTTLKVAYGPSTFFGEGPRQVDIDVSVNGGAFVNVLSTPPPVTSTVPIAFKVIDLSAFDGVTKATFRAFPYNADGSSLGDFNFYNFAKPSDPGGMFSAIRVEGDSAGPPVSSVPEPASLLIWTVGLVASVALARRPRRRGPSAD